MQNSKTKRNKIKAKVNYSKINKNITSISYTIDGITYSVFINGIYKGDLEIYYLGDKFDNTKIVKVLEKVG